VRLGSSCITFCILLSLEGEIFIRSVSPKDLHDRFSALDSIEVWQYSLTGSGNQLDFLLAVEKMKFPRRGANSNGSTAYLYLRAVGIFLRGLLTGLSAILLLLLILQWGTLDVKWQHVTYALDLI